jgi:hypothetical protein
MAELTRWVTSIHQAAEKARLLGNP